MKKFLALALIFSLGQMPIGCFKRKDPYRPPLKVAVPKKSTPAPKVDPQLAKLEKALANPSWDVRLQAVKTMGKMKAIPEKLMAKAMADKDEGVRKQVFLVLGDRKQLTAPLVQMISVRYSQESKAPRPWAARAWLNGGKDWKWGQGEFQKMVASKDALLVQEAVTVLGLMGPQALPLLQTALRHSDAWIRREAIRSLYQLSQKKPAYLVHLLPGLSDRSIRVRRATGYCFSQAGEQAVPYLNQILTKNSTYDQKLSILYVLIDLGPKARKAVPFIVPLLQQSNRMLKKNASKALAGIGAPAVHHLIQLLKSRNRRHRQAAVETLQQMGSSATPAIPSLIKALEDRFWRVRKGAAAALGAIGPDAKSAIPALIKGLAGDDEDLARHSALALGQIRSEFKLTVPALIQALNSKNRDLRVLSARSLGQIGEASAPAVPALRQALASDDHLLRYESAQTLSYIGPPARPATPELLKALQDKKPLVRMKAALALGEVVAPADQAVAPLIKALGDSSQWVRKEAAIALGAVGKKTPAVRPALQKLLKDKSMIVREAAKRGIFLLDR